MKIQHILIAASASFLLTVGNAWAGLDHRPYPKMPKPVVQVKPKPVVHVIPKPVVVVKPKPVIPVIPKPVIVVKPKPVVHVTPKPVVVVKPPVITPPPVVYVPPVVTNPPVVKPPVVYVPPSKGPKGSGHHHKAPEIDSTSGTSALVLIAGILLMLSERARSRRVWN